jgi:RNA-binding protein 25
MDNNLAFTGYPIPYGPVATLGTAYHPTQRVSQMVSVWIGKIGSGVSDRPIRSMLELLGGLSSWKRTPDPKTGVQKSFGFAEFFSPRSAVLAKSLLNELQLGDSKLLVKIDEKNQKIIDDWLAEHAKEVQNEEKESSIKTQVVAIANDLNTTLGIPSLTFQSDQSIQNDLQSPSRGTNGSTTTTTTTTTVNDTGKTNLLNSSNGHSANILESDAILTHQQETSKPESIHVKRISAIEARREEERKRDFESKLELMEEDREREQRRVEKNEKLYRSVERDLETSQRERTAGLERRKKKEEELQRLRISDLDRENALFWSSDVAEENEVELRRKIMSHDYVRERQREFEQDEIGREEEEAELRAEMRRAEERHKEQVRQQQEEQAMRMKAEAIKRLEQSSAQTKPQPTKTSSYGGTNNDKKRPSNDSIEGVPEAKSAKNSESQSSPHTIILGQMPSTITNSKVPIIPNAGATPTTTTSNLLATLTTKIPSDTASLFVTPIRWDLAEKHKLLETKIRPWVTKKIIEYLEFEEPTMIQFICTHIKERKPPKELIAQLQTILDDDTEVFVITLWRMLVLESLKMEAEESRA